MAQRLLSYKFFILFYSTLFNRLLDRFDQCGSIKVNFFGQLQPGTVAPGTGVFWATFNGNSTSLQKIVLAVIPKDFDAKSNLVLAIKLGTSRYSL